jgi:hypothetical protein
MFVTVAVVMCKLLVISSTLVPDTDCTNEEARVEEIVTDTDKDETLSLLTCSLGQSQVADWKEHHPIYHSNLWRVARIKCVLGRYQIRGQA